MQFGIRNSAFAENINSASTCDFQECGSFASVDSYKPMQAPVKLRSSKLC